jgi:hypothetical protein
MDELAVERLLSEQRRYYSARAPEYDDWWFRRARYRLDAESAEGWFADVAELEAERAENGAGRNIFRACSPADDRDNRNQRLRQSRRHRCEDTAHRTFPQAYPAPEPLDPVREEKRPCQEDCEARRQENDRTHARTLQDHQ